jgi:hypothetical protein
VGQGRAREQKRIHEQRADREAGEAGKRTGRRNIRLNKRHGATRCVWHAIGYDTVRNGYEWAISFESAFVCGYDDDDGGWMCVSAGETRWIARGKSDGARR